MPSGPVSQHHKQESLLEPSGRQGEASFKVGLGMHLAFTPQHQTLSPAIHVEPHGERGRNHTISGASVEQPVLLRTRTPLDMNRCACVPAPGVGRELRKISCPREGGFEMLPFSTPAHQVTLQLQNISTLAFCAECCRVEGEVGCG